MTARQLAAALSAELARDGWGDVALHLITRVADTEHEDPEDDGFADVEALRAVLTRVARTLS